MRDDHAPVNQSNRQHRDTVITCCHDCLKSKRFALEVLAELTEVDRAVGRQILIEHVDDQRLEHVGWLKNVVGWYRVHDDAGRSAARVVHAEEVAALHRQSIGEDDTVDADGCRRHQNSVLEDELLLAQLAPDADEDSTIRRAAEVGDRRELAVADETVVEHEVGANGAETRKARWFATDRRWAVRLVACTRRTGIL